MLTITLTLFCYHGFRLFWNSTLPGIEHILRCISVYQILTTVPPNSSPSLVHRSSLRRCQRKHHFVSARIAVFPTHPTPPPSLPINNTRTMTDPSSANGRVLTRQCLLLVLSVGCRCNRMGRNPSVVRQQQFYCALYKMASSWIRINKRCVQWRELSYSFWTWKKQHRRLRRFCMDSNDVLGYNE